MARTVVAIDLCLVYLQCLACSFRASVWRVIQSRSDAFVGEERDEVRVVVSGWQRPLALPVQQVDLIQQSLIIVHNCGNTLRMLAAKFASIATATYTCNPILSCLNQLNILVEVVFKATEARGAPQRSCIAAFAAEDTRVH